MPRHSEKTTPSLNIKEDDPSVFAMKGAVVEFAADAGEKKNKLQLTLYDGSIVKHWYWGNLAFELATMRMAKKRNPILYSHDVNQRVAYSDEASFDKKFIMRGLFLSNPIARQTKTDMDDGFPFEASLKFDEARTNILKVAEGQSVQVNGHTLKGPGTVLKNAVIIEGSLCVFGIMKDTNSKAFADINDFRTSLKPPADFFTAVEQRITKTGGKISDAIRYCREQHPELYETMLRKYPYDKKIRQHMIRIEEATAQDARR